MQTNNVVASPSSGPGRNLSVGLQELQESLKVKPHAEKYREEPTSKGRKRRIDGIQVLFSNPGCQTIIEHFFTHSSGRKLFMFKCQTCTKATSALSLADVPKQKGPLHSLFVVSMTYMLGTSTISMVLVLGQISCREVENNERSLVSLSFRLAKGIIHHCFHGQDKPDTKLSEASSGLLSPPGELPGNCEGLAAVDIAQHWLSMLTQGKVTQVTAF